jgi:hypothetical protein
MRTSKLTRAATVTAIAATAGLAIAGTASAATPAPAPAKAAKTILSIAEAKDVVSGKLAEGKDGLAKQTIYLASVKGTKSTVVAKAVTSKAGQVSFAIKPAATTSYELVFKGTKKLAASPSAVVTVKVVKAAK